LRRHRRRRSIPASSAGTGPRHDAQSTRLTTAVIFIRVDLERVLLQLVFDLPRGG
jgi:hypothetical protein